MKDIIIDDKKFCLICKEYKTFDNFVKQTTGRGGLFTYCKNCSSLKQKRDKFKRKLNNKSDKIASYKARFKEPILCHDCKEHKDINDFSIFVQKNGTVRRRSYCQKCWSIREKEFRLKREREDHYANSK